MKVRRLKRARTQGIRDHKKAHPFIGHVQGPKCGCFKAAEDDPYTWCFYAQDFPANLNKALKYLHKRYATKAVAGYWGRNRNVFDPGRYVVKLPRNADGYADNDWEGSISNLIEKLDDPYYLMYHVQYARTRLFYYKDLPVVLMEKVNTDVWVGKRYEDFPDWVGSVDCGQVGFNKRGRLVAFDYGTR